MLSRTAFWAASIVSSSFPLDSPNSGVPIACSRAALQAPLVGVVQLRARSRTDRCARPVSCGLRHPRVSFSSESSVGSGGAVGAARSAGAVQTEEPVDRLAIGVEHRRRRVQPGEAGIGDRVDAPGGPGWPGLPGRLEEAVLLHLAERPVQRAHRDPEQAESTQVILDHVAVCPLERDGQQHERREDVARRPAGQRFALVARLGGSPRWSWSWSGMLALSFLAARRA